MSKKVSPKSAHYKRTGGEPERRWIAPGGVGVVAVRDESYRWLVTEGPENLIGRSFGHMRDLRAAVKQSANPRWDENFSLRGMRVLREARFAAVLAGRVSDHVRRIVVCDGDHGLLVGSFDGSWPDGNGRRSHDPDGDFDHMVSVYENDPRWCRVQS